jgi:phage terminase Nu1 subunit (DNA packaging protein)
VTERETQRQLGKRDLCAALKWTRPRLDLRLKTDANFPVLSRGTRAGGWAFDLDAVIAYLAAEPRAAATAAPVIDMPKQPAVHRGEATARQRRDEVQTEFLSDRLRMRRGELVEADEVRIVISTMLARLGSGLDGIPDAIIKRLALPEEHASVMREILDGLRRGMVDDLRALLTVNGS